MTAVARELREAAVDALGRDAVISDLEQLRTYECDGLTGTRVVPALVILTSSTQHVQEAVRLCNTYEVPFVARGAGTGLSGGALPVADGVVISLQRMNRVLEIDLEGERVVVEPGVGGAASHLAEPPPPGAPCASPAAGHAGS